MASDNDKPRETSLPSASTVSGNETSRARSIATRLTDAEFGEVEAAAADAGKKVAEWLRFRRLVNDPLLYGVAAWLIVAYLAFVMRGDIGYEWRQLRRAVKEPQWSSNYGRDWPEGRDGIVAGLRLRIVHWINEQKTALEWPSFGPAISRRFGLKKLPNSEMVRRSDRPVSTQVRDEVSTARQLATPPPSHSPKPPSQRRTIFPGSCASDAGHSQFEPWDESEWID